MSARALVLSPNPPTGFGGMERFSLLVGQLLEEEGWAVETAWPAPTPAWPYRLGLGYPWQARSAAERGRAALGGAAPELVVASNYLGASPPAARRRIVVFHNTMAGLALWGATDQPLRDRARRVLGGVASEALATRRATVVAVADTVADEVRRLLRARVDAVIPNGVDTERFRPRDRAEARARLDLDPDGRYALYPGRIEGLKGAAVMEEAAPAAGFELLVTGTTSPRVGRALGFLDLDDLALAYNAADCVLLPTSYEGCSFVVLEALASGTPLLTTRVGWFQSFLRALPEYRALVIWRDAGDVTARLRALPELDTTPLVERGRAFVLAHNSLERWRADWRALIRSATGA